MYVEQILIYFELLVCNYRNLYLNCVGVLVMFLIFYVYIETSILFYNRKLVMHREIVCVRVHSLSIEVN